MAFLVCSLVVGGVIGLMITTRSEEPYAYANCVCPKCPEVTDDDKNDITNNNGGVETTPAAFPEQSLDAPDLVYLEQVLNVTRAAWEAVIGNSNGTSNNNGSNVTIRGKEHLP